MNRLDFIHLFTTVSSHRSPSSHLFGKALLILLKVEETGESIQDRIFVSIFQYQQLVSKEQDRYNVKKPILKVLFAVDPCHDIEDSLLSP